jgi:hypothetical protein
MAQITQTLPAVTVISAEFPHSASKIDQNMAIFVGPSVQRIGQRAMGSASRGSRAGPRYDCGFNVPTQVGDGTRGGAVGRRIPVRVNTLRRIKLLISPRRSIAATCKS